MKVIGIDLGTTNCAVAYAEDTQEESAQQVQAFPITQLTHPGNVEERFTMPSFLYIPGPHDLPQGSTALPWDKQPEYVTGWMAREQCAKIPDRVIHSAKSWLSHEGVDRSAAILPWQSPAEIPHMSPIEVAAAYLKHIAQAWDHVNPEDPFSQQEVVITVPASFDAVARDLTVQAAHQAGIKQLSLLEEPQAAFYAWLDQSQDSWRDQVQAGDRILVCDIGGGTTDFSLIAVSQQEGDLSLERIAVGEHLLLGGDNMDLTLAAATRQRLKSEGTKLDTWQLQALTHGCRVGKEQLLQELSDDDWPITIPGRGSGLIAGSKRTKLLRSDVENIILAGFFPECKISETAQHGRRVGLTELGLPFEQDPAVTRHLARFLTMHSLASSEGSEPAEEQLEWKFFHPTAILFNGGVLKAPLLRQRLLGIINGWLEAEGAPALKVLTGTDHDLAVSRGAARYGLVKRGHGIRIKGGTNRSYYVAVESSMPAIPGLELPMRALCVAPFGMEEDSSADVPKEFGLVIGREADFRFMASVVRPNDQVGDYIEDWEEDIEEITGLKTTLSSASYAEGSVVPVRLQSRVTAVGTLELWCLAQNGESWQLEFDIRNSSAS